MFFEALFTIAKIRKQLECPSTDKRVNKTSCICTMEYHSAIKRINLAICNNRNGPKRYYAKRSKSERQRQMLYDFTYFWNLKNKIDEQSKQKTNSGTQRDY